MKRVFSAVLIALLLFVPVLSAHADGTPRVFVPDGLVTETELASLNDRAEAICEAHGVGVYFFYDLEVEDLVEYMFDFISEHVTDTSALILGVNADHYYFMTTDAAIGAFPKDVTDGTLWEAFRAVKNEPYRKILAYLDAADEVLNAYDPAAASAAPAVSGDDLSVPDYIALTDAGKPAVVDRASLLTADEAETLSKKLVETGSRYQCDVVIVTVPSLGSKTSEEFADDFFDYNGYGYGAIADANGTTVNGDGILLLISMEDRDFAISTSGYGITAFTDYGIQTYLEDAFLPYLSNNRFNAGFLAFADACGELLRMAREGVPYDCLHIYASSEAVTAAQLETFESRARQQATENDLGVYFVQSDSVADMDAYLSEFLYSRASESSAIACGVGANGVGTVRVSGWTAHRLFSDSTQEALRGTVQPYLDGSDLYGAIDAYLRACEKAVAQRFVRSQALTDAQSASLNEAASELYRAHGVGVYFVETDSDEDADAFISQFLSASVAESSAIVFGKTASGHALRLSGYNVEQTFTARDLKRIEKKLAPYLAANDTNGAVQTYLARAEKVLTRTPFNWFALGIALVAGVLLGRIPVSAMKRQLTDVSMQKNADKYLAPESYAVTQNTDVLLGTNVSRTVHVTPSESSSSGPRGGGGGGFHGGSSTHTSSSGGTHGGHSGKF